MKVYINKRIGLNCGGLVIVAANSPEEAHHILMQDDNLSFYADPLDDDCNVIEDRDKWEHWFYKKENWKELDNVEYTGSEPKILSESGYSE